MESELLHTYSQVDPLDVLVLCVRLAVLVAVTLTVPVVLFPVRILHAGLILFHIHPVIL